MCQVYRNLITENSIFISVFFTDHFIFQHWSFFPGQTHLAQTLIWVPMKTVWPTLPQAAVAVAAL